MTTPHASPTSVWASDLLGASVIATQAPVAQVTGLVVTPAGDVAALQVEPRPDGTPPADQAAALLLPFDAALAYAPGEVRVVSADDVVPAFKLPTLLGHLTARRSDLLGAPVLTPDGRCLGFLWDALLDCATGALLQYRIGSAPQPSGSARSVLTGGHLCRAAQGGFTLPEPYAALVDDLINAPPDLA